MKKLVAVLILALSVNVVAKSNYETQIVKEITSVYDADTFRVNIEGWPSVVGERMPIRANGFDAPEIRGKCQREKELARKAKQMTVEALRGAKVIELRNIERGKYFRLIADVYIDGKPLKEIQLAGGISRPYTGGKRKGWCD